MGLDQPLELQRAAWSADAGLAYVYVQPTGRTPVHAALQVQLRRRWQQLFPAAVAIDVSRLALMSDLPGCSRTSTPLHHYVVETDAQEGWAQEIAHWYDAEHLPGLAAVPGCIRARRFVNHDGGPWSLACYDLVSEGTLGSPPWLAVRGTAWSSRARPHFLNTRRTMMRVVA